MFTNDFRECIFKFWHPLLTIHALQVDPSVDKQLKLIYTTNIRTVSIVTSYFIQTKLFFYLLTKIQEIRLSKSQREKRVHNYVQEKIILQLITYPIP